MIGAMRSAVLQVKHQPGIVGPRRSHKGPAETSFVVRTVVCEIYPLQINWQYFFKIIQTPRIGIVVIICSRFVEVVIDSWGSRSVLLHMENVMHAACPINLETFYPDHWQYKTDGP